MKRRIATAILGAALSAVGIGCHDNSPPPSRVPVPSARNNDARTQWDAPRPLELPPPDSNAGRAYDDEPLLNQRPPEQRAFVDAYNRVGRPRIAVFVNRNMTGDIIPVNPSEPDSSTVHTRRSTTGMVVDQREISGRNDRWNNSRTERNDRFESKGPAEYQERTETFSKPSQYDEINAKQLDYEAVENIMTDWLAANGQTTMISPIMARQRLTDEQLKDLQSGRPIALSELAQQLGTDILVQVQARPSRQVGYAVRMVAEAINTRGGQSIGRAVVDVPPPLDKTQINRYTRFLARKLMDDMTGTWGAVAMSDVRAPGEMKSPVPNPLPPPEKPLPPGDKPSPTPSPISPPETPMPPPEPPKPPTTQEKPLPQPQPPLPDKPAPSPGSQPS